MGLCLFNLLNQNPSAPDKSAHNVIISFLWEIPAGIGTNDQERKQDSNLEHEHKNRAVKKIILIKADGLLVVPATMFSNHWLRGSVLN